DSIAFRLSRNTGMPSADLGDPLTVTGWELCVIGGAPTSPALVFGARIPPAGTCGRGPCWRATRTGWAYADRAGSRAGIGYFQLTAGAAPTAGVTFRGRGGALASAVPVPAASLPLTVQVRSPGSGCYEATFGAVGVRRNDPANGRFVATGTP